MKCSPPSSSVHGILQAKILEWVSVSFSRGSSWPRDRIWVSCLAGRFLTIWVTREAPRSYVIVNLSSTCKGRGDLWTPATSAFLTNWPEIRCIRWFLQFQAGVRCFTFSLSSLIFVCFISLSAFLSISLLFDQFTSLILKRTFIEGQLCARHRSLFCFDHYLIPQIIFFFF